MFFPLVYLFYFFLNLFWNVWILCFRFFWLSLIVSWNCFARIAIFRSSALRSKPGLLNDTQPRVAVAAPALRRQETTELSAVLHQWPGHCFIHRWNKTIPSFGWFMILFYQLSLLVSLILLQYAVCIYIYMLFLNYQPDT